MKHVRESARCQLNPGNRQPCFGRALRPPWSSESRELLGFRHFGMKARALGQPYRLPCSPLLERLQEMRRLAARRPAMRPDLPKVGRTRQEPRCRLAPSADRGFPSEDGRRRKKCRLWIALAYSFAAGDASRKCCRGDSPPSPSATCLERGPRHLLALLFADPVALAASLQTGSQPQKSAADRWFH